MELYTLGTPAKQPELPENPDNRPVRDRLWLLFYDHFGPQAEDRVDDVERIAALADKGFPADFVVQGATKAIESNRLHLDVVKEEAFRLWNRATPRLRHCSAGASVIELTANGDYARCLRYAPKGRFMGNIFKDGKINLLDPKTDSNCELRCQKRMCHARSTIRTHTKEEFDQKFEELGVRGDYGNYCGKVELPDAKMCVRWRITETCNYRCSYCSAWKTVNTKQPERKGHDILDAAKILLDQFDGLWLRITGGEPSVVRNYVELMQYLHSRLDRLACLEIRTNFSYPKKQRAIFDLDWQGKLDYHIGCHVYDVNFKPWEWVDLLKDPGSVKYVVKFVHSTANGKYVDYFHDYFIKNGIDPKKIRILSDVRDEAEDNSEVPPAYAHLTNQLQLAPT